MPFSRGAQRLGGSTEPLHFLLGCVPPGAVEGAHPAHRARPVARLLVHVQGAPEQICHSLCNRDLGAGRGCSITAAASANSPSVRFTSGRSTCSGETPRCRRCASVFAAGLAAGQFRQFRQLRLCGPTTEQPHGLGGPRVLQGTECRNQFTESGLECLRPVVALLRSAFRRASATESGARPRIGAIASYSSVVLALITRSRSRADRNGRDRSAAPTHRAHTGRHRDAALLVLTVAPVRSVASGRPCPAHHHRRPAGTEAHLAASSRSPSWCRFRQPSRKAGGRCDHRGESSVSAYSIDSAKVDLPEPLPRRRRSGPARVRGGAWRRRRCPGSRRR